MNELRIKLCPTVRYCEHRRPLKYKISFCSSFEYLLILRWPLSECLYCYNNEVSEVFNMNTEQAQHLYIQGVKLFHVFVK